MDIECYEWEVMVQILSEPGLLESIRILHIEFHMFEDKLPYDRYPAYLTMLQRLREVGFELVITTKSPSFSCQSDLQTFRNKTGNGKLRHWRENTYLNRKFL